ncbi:metallo-beta-lactamase superfamily protein [Striga asiatica]|uniref:Metallo-beta-lactamase superfamily protein n=1 Tax=Striga asiatica TaxID=4170 RepID=A0A5A7PMN7_STRAF|nr:metallo-beta-lactamase superfamily protein [Striga asiatica]
MEFACLGTESIVDQNKEDGITAESGGEVTQGVGVQLNVSSAGDVITLPEELRGIAYKVDGQASKWLWTQGEEKQMNKEEEIVAIRDWLLQKVEEGCQRVEIFTRSKGLAKILHAKETLGVQLQVVMEDIYDICTMFYSCQFKEMS